MSSSTFGKVAFLLCLLLSTVDVCNAYGATSRLQVQLPKELRRENGYDHREALFGLPPYGGSIHQNVYYADSELCDPQEDYTTGGYPVRPTDKATGKMEPWKTPFLLMIDRGECTFVKKVRNAQRSGAAGVIIADNTCLCDDLDACFLDDPNDCETKEPIMADDGSGADITIPSFLMFKQDADPIKEALKANTAVRMEMAWALPREDDRVEYELWTTPKDQVSRQFQRNFRPLAIALGEHAQFTPRMYIYDGLSAGCQGIDGQNQCYNMCTNNGRYCSTDPDDNMEVGLSGADVVTESLRRICIWKEYGKDGIGVEWWDYVEEFMHRCDDKSISEGLFKNKDCIRDAMDHANIEWHIIEECMSDAGGLEADEQNNLLETEMAALESSGVVILPSLYVNNVPLRGALVLSEVFEAICSGYATGSEPEVCKKCDRCDDLESCVNRGHCPGAVGSGDVVSLQTFASSLVAVVLIFGVCGIFMWQRSQRQMRDQVRGVLAEYMPIDENTKLESIGFESENEIQ